MHRVKRVFRWGAEREIVPLEVVARLGMIQSLKKGEAGTREKPRVMPVSDDHFEKSLPFLKSRARAVVVILRRTGARVGEICRMRPCDIDRTSDPWTYTPTSHKSEAFHERVIHLGPLAREGLEPLLKGVVPTDFIFKGPR